MSRTRKDGKFLNAYIDKTIYEKFENCCNRLGQSKTTGIERALEMYTKKNINSKSSDITQFENE